MNLSFQCLHAVGLFANIQSDGPKTYRHAISHYNYYNHKLRRNRRGIFIRNVCARVLYILAYFSMA